MYVVFFVVTVVIIYSGELVMVDRRILVAVGTWSHKVKQLGVDVRLRFGG